MTSASAASRTASRAKNSTWLEVLTRAGLVGYGLLHLAIAWLAVQLATGHPGDHADQSGAFRLLEQQPLGHALLVIIALGLAAMALWQLLLAAVGHREYSGRRRVLERVASFGRVLIYILLLWTDIRVLQDPSTSSASSQQKATAGVLAHQSGQVVVAIAGVVVFAISVGMVIYGLKKGFLSKLRFGNANPQVRRGVTWLGQLGYVGRGLAIAIVGGLLVDAALSNDSARSRGLDGALRTLASHSFGAVLLAIIAIGFAAFGVYCCFQAKYRKI
jgi:Domain of Unknown Function (DUF1206)